MPELDGCRLRLVKKPVAIAVLSIQRSLDRDRAAFRIFSPPLLMRLLLSEPVADRRGSVQLAIRAGHR